MKKTIVQFFILIALFFGVWFLLSKINWLSVFKVEQVSKSVEEKLGEVFWQLFSKAEEEVYAENITRSIDTLVTHICKHNSIDRSAIKLHLLKKDDINAFTLPDNYLIVYSGLIHATENEAELIGVLAHEIAHMEKNHVMKKLVKEVGLSMLISLTTGNGSGEAIKEAAKLLSSTAFDRDMEREADLTAVHYLLKAGIDPGPFADFLYRLSEEEKNMPSQAYWISTHPGSKERAEAIVAGIKNKDITRNKVLSPEKWDTLKTLLKNIP